MTSMRESQVISLTSASVESVTGIPSSVIDKLSSSSSPGGVLGGVTNGSSKQNNGT